VCSGACTNTTFDPSNCGACGTVCGPYNNGTASCQSSACLVTCNANFANCDGNLSNGCETDVRTSNSHCGRCGNACATGSSCTNGVCPNVGSFPGSTLINANQAALINGWIGTPSQIWRLCYRRSTHGASSSTFHSQCNGLGPSVVVLSNNQGRLFGGYASQGWNSNNQYYGDTNSFLFSLTNQHRHSAPGQYGSGTPYWNYGNQSYGPTWGGGHDLYIDNAMSSGYCNLGHNYTCRVGSYSSTQCHSDFCGVYSGWQVTELEAWVRQ